MSLIKKSDVKNHLSPRRHTAIHLHPPASQPDATGFSGEESRQPAPQAGLAVREPSEQPAPGVPATPSTVIKPGLKPVLVPKASQSAQA